MASATAAETHAFEAINALNTLAQKGDRDACDAIARIVDHALARQEQTEAVLASQVSVDEVEI